MGCRLIKSYLTIVEPSVNREINVRGIDLVQDAHDLLNYLKNEKNVDYKCIFIFGGYGSNKGEFIFELFASESSRVEKLKEQYGWAYTYLDVEALIINNIKKRVLQLTGQETQAQNNGGTDEATSSAGNDGCPEDPRWEDIMFLRRYFAEMSNIITNNWVRQLIEQEIKASDESGSDSKFIINLIPNRINLLRDSLYLKQGPNFHNFEYEFIAINLIRTDHTKKDLDLVSDYHCYEDINEYFVDYFRSIEKLVEVKIETKKIEPRVKISRVSAAIKVKNAAHLEELLKKRGNDFLELNISEFDEESTAKGPLFFLVDGHVDTGEEMIAIDPSESDINGIKKFVHFYMRIKNNLDLQ